MSSEELLESYVDGSISRRDFIRRLVAGGVTIGAAVSYAHLLAPGTEAAERRWDSFYLAPPYSATRRAPTTVAWIVRHGWLPFIVEVKGPRGVYVRAKADLLKPDGKHVEARLGEASVKLKSHARANRYGVFHSRRIIHIPLTESGEQALRRILRQGPQSALVRLTGVATTSKGGTERGTEVQSIPRRL